MLAGRFYATARPKIKTPPERRRNYQPGCSDGALDLIGAEASGTRVNMAGSSVNHGLHTLDVGLPCTIGPSVGVGNLNTEGHAFSTKITLSHSLHLPSECLNKLRPSQALNYDTRLSPKMQALFSKFFDFREALTQSAGASESPKRERNAPCTSRFFNPRGCGFPSGGDDFSRDSSESY